MISAGFLLISRFLCDFSLECTRFQWWRTPRRYTSFKWHSCQITFLALRLSRALLRTLRNHFNFSGCLLFVHEILNIWLQTAVGTRSLRCVIGRCVARDRLLALITSHTFCLRSCNRVAPLKFETVTEL